LKKIGCFHAHHSNIEHVEKALHGFEAELIHFVDPGLDRIKKDADFSKETVEKKVIETLDWIAGGHVDAILMTCTFFTAAYDEHNHPYPIPILKIDDPLFEEICNSGQPTAVVFTNPNTVKGTMNQLLTYARRRGKEIEAEPFLLENTFDLIMQGKKSEYIDAVSKGLLDVLEKHADKSVVAAQLSMVSAAKATERLRNIPIANPLDSLARYMRERLALLPKGNA
jgi:hypothetical protein